MIQNYLEDHIPHRVNLLITFRERYSDKGSRKIANEAFRDFYRCAKDISILMIRFFLEEMGVKLKKGTREIRRVDKWTSRHNVLQLDIDSIKMDPRYFSLIQVLVAANRAVAHIDDTDVDHDLVGPQGDEALFSSIDLVQDYIKTNIYSPNNESLERVMLLPNNVM